MHVKVDATLYKNLSHTVWRYLSAPLNIFGLGLLEFLLLGFMWTLAQPNFLSDWFIFWTGFLFLGLNHYRSIKSEEKLEIITSDTRMPVLVISMVTWVACYGFLWQYLYTSMDITKFALEIRLVESHAYLTSFCYVTWFLLVMGVIGYQLFTHIRSKMGNPYHATELVKRAFMLGLAGLMLVTLVASVAADYHEMGGNNNGEVAVVTR